MSQTVLLTGISGFIGLHCAKELLDAGFKVKGTVRNSALSLRWLLHKKPSAFRPWRTATACFVDVKKAVAKIVEYDKFHVVAQRP